MFRWGFFWIERAIELRRSGWLLIKAAAMARDWSLWLTGLPARLQPWRSSSQAAKIPRPGKKPGELAKELTIHKLACLATMAGVAAATPDEEDVLEAETHLIEHWARYPVPRGKDAAGLYETKLQLGQRFFDAYDRLFWAACDTYLIGLNETALGGPVSAEAAAAGREKFITRVYEQAFGEKRPAGWQPPTVTYAAETPRLDGLRQKEDV